MKSKPQPAVAGIATNTPSGVVSPKKRHSPTSSIPSPNSQRPTFAAPSSPRRRSSAGGQISRSISACNRCRSRKTKCDQLFPSCSSCAKAGVDCVGIDAATGREVPRSYVDWLEKRVKFLEREMGMVVDGSGDQGEGGGGGGGGGGRARGTGSEGIIVGITGGSKRKLSGSPSEGGDERRRRSESNVERALGRGGSSRNSITMEGSGVMTLSDGEKTEEKALRLRPDIENLVSQVGLVSVHGTSAPGFVGGSSGISFARLMFAAVKMTNKDNNQPLSQPSNSATFSINPASDISPRPTTESTDTAADSATQMTRQRAVPEPFPRRHVGEKYINMYFNLANPQTPILHRPSFGRIFRRVCVRIEQEGSNGAAGEGDLQHHADLYFLYMVFAVATAMDSTSGTLPEQYHASAMLHMDGLFSTISATNNRLDGLKGLLLLALYSIMRPAAPGVWYVLGAALRLAIDLGLHQENTLRAEKWDPLIVDERRRLWWCTYALDRQLGLYLGRPFGIADEAIRTPLPVEELEGWSDQGEGIQKGQRTCRTIFLHIFRIRRIQSEIQQVLYQSSSSLPRQFASVEDWRNNVEERLQAWCETVPRFREDTNCGYNLSFIDLNFEQTRLLLYGLCPTIPRPSVSALEAIAESGERIIRLYRQLHQENCINYTWLACHNLFMAGTSYLCALWHCPEVRRQTTIEEIDYNNMACVGVLSSMIDRCPAAQGCRDVFDNLAKATVDLCSAELSRDRDSSNKRVKTENTGWTSAGSKSLMAFTPVPQSLPADLANIVHAQHYQPPPPHLQPLLQPQPNYSEMMPPPLPIQSGDGMFIPPEFATECMNMDGLRVFEMMQLLGAPGGGEWDGSSWPAWMVGGYGNGSMGMGSGFGDSSLFGGWTWS